MLNVEHRHKSKKKRIKKRDELIAKQFPGDNEAEVNFFPKEKVNGSPDRIADRAHCTELLFQPLTTSAKEYMAAYLNEIQTRTGKDNLPDLLDAILQIEQRFVAIQPTHAKQQLFTKAHRASQFATFTTKEDREHHFDTR